MRLSPCVLVRPDGWARGEREGYGEPCDVTSLSLSTPQPQHAIDAHQSTSDKLRGGGGAAVSGNRRAHEENSEPVP